MQAVKAWIETTPYAEYAISIASADASFRKYYRLTQGDKSFLVMDSSLEKESLAPFLNVTKRLAHAGVNVPKIYEQDLEKGYLSSKILAIPTCSHSSRKQTSKHSTKKR